MFFGVNPGGGRRASLIERTPPGKDDDGRGSPPRVSETPYMTPPAGSSGGSGSESKGRRGPARELRVRLYRTGAEPPRVSTPIPPAGQSLVLFPAGEESEAMPPPTPEGPLCPPGREVGEMTGDDTGSSGSVSIVSDGDYADGESVVSVVRGGDAPPPEKGRGGALRRRAHLLS